MKMLYQLGFNGGQLAARAVHLQLGSSAPHPTVLLDEERRLVVLGARRALFVRGRVRL